MIETLINPAGITKDDPRLFNAGELALILNVTRAYLTRLKKCGFKMPGGKASVGAVHRFLENCPDVPPSPVSKKRKGERQAGSKAVS